VPSMASITTYSPSTNSNGNYTSSWSATSSQGLVIQGKAMCRPVVRQMAPDHQEAIDAALAAGGGVIPNGSGQYCFCKVMSPSVGVWGLQNDRGDSDVCRIQCAWACASDFAEYYSARTLWSGPRNP
jgi:hypothetical protein